MINKCEGDSRKLFRVISSLCNKRPSNLWPEHDSSLDLANDFGKFFASKIDLIKEKISAIHTDSPLADSCGGPEAYLTEFAAVSDEDIMAIIRNSSNSTCRLDPIPSPLLKECHAALVPAITRMVNLSLKQGIVPDSWKTAHITPLLKKLDLTSLR